MWKVRGGSIAEESYCARNGIRSRLMLVWLLFVSLALVGWLLTRFSRTTIIEALKYAITGSLPPGGAKAGQNFVHDPRAIGSSLVKAQVKLRFTSRSSQTMVVVRSELGEVARKRDVVIVSGL